MTDKQWAERLRRQRLTAVQWHTLTLVLGYGPALARDISGQRTGDYGDANTPWRKTFGALQALAEFGLVEITKGGLWQKATE